MSHADRTDRLFFALLPPAEVLADLDELALGLGREHGWSGAPLGPARYHVTLFFVGDFAGLSDARLAALAAAAESVLPAPALPLSFDRLASLGPPGARRPAVLLSSDVLAAAREFQQRLAAAVKQRGLPGEERPWLPHLTLYRAVPEVVEQALPPLGWTATELVLQRSLIGRGRHETLARWPLLQGEASHD